jgi:DNA modification methylase
MSVLMGSEPINTYELFRQGSETIHENPDFQKYKGKLDFVFTSPPYFNREAYSDDENQSYKKFSSYDSWKEGFLRKTLETAYEYLKPNRYLVWNIADVLVGTNKDGTNKYLPLEQDTIEIMKSLGAEYLGTDKLALMNMPGQNRIKEDGTPNTRCFARIKNSKGVEEWIKTEPILVFKKP